MGRYTTQIEETEIKKNISVKLLQAIGVSNIIPIEIFLITCYELLFKIILSFQLFSAR